MSEANRITSIEQLEALYGEPSAGAVAKEIDYISGDYRAFIEASPFVLLSTVGEDGTDCSPRGDPAGFVRVVDERTVMMPDRRGNNRVDSLRNIIHDGHCSLLFLIPGVGETLRINGRAHLSIEPALLESFAMDGKLPRSIVVVEVDRVYFQCQKALARSGLWKPEAQIPRSELPSTGQMIKALMQEPFDAEEYDRNYPKHMANTIY
ncbi:MAG TPA: pyridoxamine 5'-phosphate oxidase family protein [Alphaproteobacteria bacterium]|nr:pyridoxamine 5'-phosphate oxidase family protein [Alphaproteobacteria bacterium]